MEKTLAYVRAGVVSAVIATSTVRFTAKRILFKLLNVVCNKAGTQMILAKQSTKQARDHAEFEHVRQKALGERSTQRNYNLDSMREKLGPLNKKLSEELAKISRSHIPADEHRFKDELKRVIAKKKKLSAEKAKWRRVWLPSCAAEKAKDRECRVEGCTNEATRGKGGGYCGKEACMDSLKCPYCGGRPKMRALGYPNWKDLSCTKCRNSSASSAKQPPAKKAAKKEATKPAAKNRSRLEKEREEGAAWMAAYNADQAKKKEEHFNYWSFQEAINNHRDDVFCLLKASAAKGESSVPPSIMQETRYKNLCAMRAYNVTLSMSESVLLTRIGEAEQEAIRMYIQQVQARKEAEKRAEQDQEKTPDPFENRSRPFKQKEQELEKRCVKSGTTYERPQVGESKYQTSKRRAGLNQLCGDYIK